MIAKISNTYVHENSLRCNFLPGSWVIFYYGDSIATAAVITHARPSDKACFYCVAIPEYTPHDVEEQAALVNTLLVERSTKNCLYFESVEERHLRLISNAHNKQLYANVDYGVTAMEAVSRFLYASDCHTAIVHMDDYSKPMYITISLPKAHYHKLSKNYTILHGVKVNFVRMSWFEAFFTPGVTAKLRPF